MQELVEYEAESSPGEEQGQQVSTSTKQFDLFTQFLGRRPADLSNTIELWDIIPKFSATPRAQTKLRDENGRLPVLELPFQYRPSTSDEKLSCTVRVHPASIKEDDKFVDYYPSANEELLENVLRKFFSDQRYGQVNGSESWVSWNLYMLAKEYKARGKSRSMQEIQKSIQIASGAVYEVLIGGDKKNYLFKGSMLSNFGSVEQLDLDGFISANYAAQLPSLVTKSINSIDYRQFNYARLMKFPNSLARWIYLRLCHYYVNASYTSPYSILYSTIRDNSHLLNHPRNNRNISDCAKALKSLVDEGVLMKIEEQQRLNGKKIEDVYYTMLPSMDFVSEMKASNKRVRDAKIEMGMIIPIPKQRQRTRWS